MCAQFCICMLQFSDQSECMRMHANASVQTNFHWCNLYINVHACTFTTIYLFWCNEFSFNSSCKNSNVQNFQLWFLLLTTLLQWNRFSALLLCSLPFLWQHLMVCELISQVCMLCKQVNYCYDCSVCYNASSVVLFFCLFCRSFAASFKLHGMQTRLHHSLRTLRFNCAWKHGKKRNPIYLE